MEAIADKQIQPVGKYSETSVTQSNYHKLASFNNNHFIRADGNKSRRDIHADIIKERTGGGW